MKALLLLLALTAVVLAEDIYLVNGGVLYNCQIIEETEEFVTVRTHEGTRRFKPAFIERIDRKPYIAAEKTRVIMPDGLPEAAKQAFNAAGNNAHYPNLKLLPVAVLGGVLTWSFFDAISYINKLEKDIEDAKRINPDFDPEPLPNSKGKLIVQGTLCAAATVATLILVFQTEDVAVSSNGQELSLNVRF